MAKPNSPDVIQPDQTYTLDIHVTWTVTGSNVEDITFRAVLWFLSTQTRESEETTSRGGSRTFHYMVDSRSVDFGMQGNTITAIFGRGIMCGGGSSGNVSVSVVQAYARRGRG